MRLLVKANEMRQPLYLPYEEWADLVESGPLYIASNVRSARYPGRFSGVMKRGRDCVRVHRARKWGNEISVTKEVLRLTPNHMEFLNNSGTDYNVLRVVLSYYGLGVEYPVLGKTKWLWSVVWPSFLEDEAAFNVSVPIQAGLEIGYDGKCYSHKVPTARQARKMYDTAFRRSKSAQQRQECIKKLGFYSAFELEGYLLPQGLDHAKTDELNAIAHKLGYRNVAAAWEAEVPIYGEVTDEFLTEHQEGLTSLLVQAEKERRQR